MANFIMLPDGVTGTNEWHASSGSDFAALVSNYDGGSNYIYEQASTNQEITFTMANPAIHEADIDFDDDVIVQAHMNADYTFVGLGSDFGAPHTYSSLNIGITGTGINLIGVAKTLTTEDGSYPLYSTASFTFKSIGVDWDYAGLENCQVKLENTNARPVRFHSVRVTYVYIKVLYTPLVTARENSTFFGANF